MFGDRQDVFLELILEARKIIRHVSCKVNVVLRRHFLHVKRLRHGSQEFQLCWPLLPDERIPAVQQSSLGILGDPGPWRRPCNHLRDRKVAGGHPP